MIKNTGIQSVAKILKKQVICLIVDLPFPIKYKPCKSINKAFMKSKNNCCNWRIKKVGVLYFLIKYAFTHTFSGSESNLLHNHNVLYFSVLDFSEECCHMGPLVGRQLAHPSPRLHLLLLLPMGAIWTMSKPNQNQLKLPTCYFKSGNHEFFETFRWLFFVF